jgi:hypothetical protein
MMAAIGHMPFAGHRNQKQVREDDERKDPSLWCPPEYRAHYNLLQTSCRLSAADARSLIEDQISMDGQRRAHG